MIQDNRIQVKEQKINAQNNTYRMKSAFKPIIYAQRGLKIQGNWNKMDLEKIIPQPSRQLLSSVAYEHSIYEGETWSRAQIEKLFRLYDYYGPQWKIMSQQMASRTANNLKNRFYTVLRNLIKLLFRKKKDSCPKLSGQILSKDLSRLYDGKENYIEFKTVVPRLLRQLDYNLDNENIDLIVQEYSKDIIKIHRALYGERADIAQEQDRFSHKKSDEISYTPSNSVQKSEEFQKLNQQSTISNMGNIIDVSFNLQQPNYYYFFIFNPSEIYIPQII